MEHTKKMILVVPRQIEKWKETMVDKSLSRLDGEMYEMLHRDMADDEKAKLYSNSLSRYLNIDKPNVLTKFESKESPAILADHSPMIEYQVLDTVPKKWRTQASRLLTHIKVHPDIGWSSKGELVLKNNVIPHTHAVDLVNDLLRKRTSSSLPTGWRLLADALKDSNIPHELIGNQDRWKYISTSSEEAQPVTSSRRDERQQRLNTWVHY